MGDFIGQMAAELSSSIKTITFLFIFNVPRNMTKYYQPLDLTVNGYCKKFLKRKFTQWYPAEVTRQLADKVALEDVQVKI